MALTVEELGVRRDQLQRILFAPQKRVRFEDGTEVDYKTDDDVRAAIVEIDGILNGRSRRFVRVAPTNGYR